MTTQPKAYGEAGLELNKRVVKVVGDGHAQREDRSTAPEPERARVC